MIYSDALKRFLILVMISFATSGIKSQTDYQADFKQSCLYSENTDSTEIITEITHYDFSKILQFDKYNYDLGILGYIGPNFQRFQIHFISVIKNPNSPSEYFVYGKSKVNQNICEFQGTINLFTGRYYKESELDTIKQGFLMAAYRFYEKPNQKHSGYFEGLVKSEWYITETGYINYDDLSRVADGYSNNEFVGIWKSYDENITKVCNWAEGRIPYSGSLDVGTGEFFPDKKYLDYGWKVYLLEYDNYLKNGTRNEWWK
jgi:hypothetical protein